MQAGRLKDRATLLKRDPSVRPENLGQLSKGWLRVRDMWVGIESITGRESWSGGANLASAEMKIVTKYWPDITDKHRLLIQSGMFKGRTVEILGVQPIGTDHLEIPCRWMRSAQDGASTTPDVQLIELPTPPQIIRPFGVGVGTDLGDVEVTSA